MPLNVLLATIHFASHLHPGSPNKNQNLNQRPPFQPSHAENKLTPSYITGLCVLVDEKLAPIITLEPRTKATPSFNG